MRVLFCNLYPINGMLYIDTEEREFGCKDKRTPINQYTLWSINKWYMESKYDMR